MPITHAKVSGEPDGLDTSLIQPTDWNAEHEGEAVPQSMSYSTSSPNSSGGYSMELTYTDPPTGGTVELTITDGDGDDHVVDVPFDADDVALQAVLDAEFGPGATGPCVGDWAAPSPATLSFIISPGAGLLPITMTYVSEVTGGTDLDLLLTGIPGQEAAVEPAPIGALVIYRNAFGVGDPIALYIRLDQDDDASDWKLMWAD